MRVLEDSMEGFQIKTKQMDEILFKWKTTKNLQLEENKKNNNMKIIKLLFMIER